jgi:pyridinium-3,5-biscarboxylic acid mononucleotide synthase
MTSTSDFVADHDRKARIGLDEAVFCASKTPEQIASIVSRLSGEKKPALFTRLAPELLAALPEQWRRQLEWDALSQTAVLGSGSCEQKSGLVAIVSGGTSDARIVAECNRTLAYYGFEAAVCQDVGVAGLWRLQSSLSALKEFPVIVVVAGMDAALPTVIAGLLPAVIIAVPSSTGYGVAAGGNSALASMLSSCAPGLVVVNIDNGFGAACAAVRVLNAMNRLHGGS